MPFDDLKSPVLLSIPENEETNAFTDHLADNLVIEEEDEPVSRDVAIDFRGLTDLNPSLLKFQLYSV